MRALMQVVTNTRPDGDRGPGAVDVPAAGGARPAQEICVLYAGNMDFARVQFASEAPQLQVIALGDGLQRGPLAADAVVFIDCGSPAVNAAAILEDLRGRRLQLPVVLGLDPGIGDAAQLALELGVDDYTVKSPGWLSRLPVRLTLVIARHRQLGRAADLQANEQRLRSIVESAPVCFARIARDGTILAMNNAARAMMGAAQASDVLRKSIFAFVSPEDGEAFRLFITHVCAEPAGSLEFSLAAAAGARRVEASAVKVAVSPGGDETAVIVLRDVSGRLRLEQAVVDKAAADTTDRQLVESQRLRQAAMTQLEARYQETVIERDVLLASISHSTERMRGLVAEAARRETEIEQLKADRDNLRGGREDVLRERDELRRELDAQRSAPGVDPAHVSALRESLERTETALGQLSTERDDLQRRLDATSASLAQAVARQQSHVQQLERWESERRVLEEQLAAAIEARSGLERGLSDAEFRVQRVTNEAQEASDRRLEEWTRERQDAESERLALLTALEDAHRQQAADRAAARELDRALQIRIDESDKARAAAMAERDDALKKLASSCGRLERLLSEARAELERLSDVTCEPIEAPPGADSGGAPS